MGAQPLTILKLVKKETCNFLEVTLLFDIIFSLCHLSIQWGNVIFQMLFKIDCCFFCEEFLHIELLFQYTTNQFLYFIISTEHILLYKVLSFFCLQRRISLTTELIWFSFRGKLCVGPEMVLGYFIFIKSLGIFLGYSNVLL